ncbi:hypothetical protein SYK_06780 [Pseudodesulfovibrio nedwellii]|uniref:Uncharacterized protein n=1 Tax=Pseudodesulfovibrio nedwellii TaxID=2973072 RepID=A0ABN6S0Q6_9BACT|nr:hypothetical protein [Pseudodesulfovibrio nedwellii]BDQ35915.1 hypothetical protein SYK_02750 [Pseudodesulfovibrio nedwellii]BDQ36318.1 hypothetical protein SYK_06780 [Pseudodesulfovibrio nedwellii]
METTPKQDAQHALNETTIYCRLCDAGMTKGMARRVSKWFGLMVNPYLYDEKARV